jgi:hypothetical protein
MSSKNVKTVAGEKVNYKNPYREGTAIHALFGEMWKRKVFSRGEILKFAEENDIDVKTASAMTSALTSPTKEDIDGRDCRGHVCVKGHVHYTEELERKVVDDKKQPQMFKFHWREFNLEPIKPYAVKKIKVAKAPKIVKPKVVKAKKTKIKAEKVVAPEVTTETTDTVVA